MKRKIIETIDFRKSFNKLSKDIRDSFNKQIMKLRDFNIDPYSVGDPLGTIWLREIKQKGFRLFLF